MCSFGSYNSGIGTVLSHYGGGSTSRVRGRLLPAAVQLSANHKGDLKKAAEIIRAGKIIAFPFNGIFGLFGDIDRVKAANLILRAKSRPPDRKLIQVCLPEEVDGKLADLSKVPHDKQRIVNLWKEVHALGLILPAASKAPRHLIVEDTVLVIWTEYAPLRYMLEHFRKLGGRGLVGTSANKAGESTHWRLKELAADFRFDVAALIEADFSHLDETRRRSTSIINFTGKKPRLIREGNVPRHEINKALIANSLPELHVDANVFIVKPRE